MSDEPRSNGPESPPGDTLGLIRRSASGDESAHDRLVPLVYDELHRLAAGYLARERREHTLQATALVNEAWLRLVEQDAIEDADRRHFTALAAQAMRRVLVDHARARQAEKRGGGRWSPVTLSTSDLPVDDAGLDLLELEDLLERLSAEEERLGQIVTLRFFGGLTLEEVAEVVGVSKRTVSKDWAFARGWLSRELGGGATD